MKELPERQWEPAGEIEVKEHGQWVVLNTWSSHPRSAIRCECGLWVTNGKTHEERTGCDRFKAIQLLRNTGV